MIHENFKRLLREDYDREFKSMGDYHESSAEVITMWWSDNSRLQILKDLVETKYGGQFQSSEEMMDVFTYEVTEMMNDEMESWNLDKNLNPAPPLTAKTVMGSAPDKIEISSEMEM